MRKLILKMSVSVDGFVARSNGELGWVFKTTGDDVKAWIVDTIARAGVHIMGSRTFRDMAAYWPSSTEPFAASMNQIPKVVFSRKGLATPEGLGTWTTARVASADLADEIARLKQEPGHQDILAHGGATFAQSLAKLGVVDEYQLLVHPVALGQGLPIFSTLTAPMELTLVTTKVFASGAIAHVYRR